MSTTVIESKEARKTMDIKTIKAAIPAHCFEASPLLSSWFILRDLTMLLALFALATYIPLIESLPLRVTAWTVYGFVQGLVGVGIWICAHECGHGALYKTSRTNNTVGFLLHTLLMVPFFSWKYSHARHHRYTNNMEKDTAFVPRETNDSYTRRLSELLGHTEDAPIVTLASLLMHQLLGWPAYLLMYVTAGKNSKPASAKANQAVTVSHFDPFNDLFTASEKPFIALTDCGLIAMAAILYQLAKVFGPWTMALAYGLPYLWINHWIVAITFLHHTHESVEHFSADKWTYTDGALSTVDRDFGFIGRHLFHGIIEYHVIHHLFTRIPFYHAEEATHAIQPMLGKRYHRETTPFWTALWSTYRTCTHVVESKTEPGVMHWAHTQ